MRFYLATAVALCTYVLSFGQQNCGQHILEEALRSSDPAIEQKFQDFNSEILPQQYVSGSRADVKIIPVVFHIIHMNGEENITDEQVYDAMRILNEDYSATNVELEEVVAGFENIIGNAEIEFRLARLDPSGNVTSGIERIQSNETFVGDDGSKLNPWPRSKYLNIWVTDQVAIAQAAAYAYRPPAADGMPSVDGVLSNHRYVGSIGTSTVGERAKTLTHEIGHYLGLPHPWGETNSPGCDGSNPNPPCNGVNNCNTDDGVSDTPNTLGVDNSNCNLTQVTCGSLDNIQNFMDYADCEAMFTEGQVNLMRASLASGVAQRSSLSTTSNLAATGVDDLTEAKFYVERKFVCTQEEVQFFDESAYDPDSWEWTITGPEATYTSNDQHPVFVFAKPGTYDVELTVTQGSTTKSVIQQAAFAVTEGFGTGVPFYDDFSEGNDGWSTDNHEEEGGNAVWKYVTNVGKGDNFCYKMASLAEDAFRLDDLTFSSIDFRSLSNTTVSFDVAYARIVSGNTDKLQLDISNDCGFTWRTVWSASGDNLDGNNDVVTSAFTPTSDDQWKTFSVSNLPEAWVSGNTALRFRFTSGGGNNLYLDNVNVDGEYESIPVLVYPSDLAQDMNDNVTLDWRSVPGSSSYEYQLDVNNSFNSSSLISGSTTYIGASSEGEDTRFTTSALEHGQQYFWKVRSISNSVTSAWSEVWSFTVADDGVGILDIDQKNPMVVYPNPATERLNIQLAETVNVSVVEVYDISGLRVLQLPINEKPMQQVTINTEHLSTGSYIVRIQTEDAARFSRFTISK